MSCPECNPNPPTSWRDQPMNEEIRKRLVIQPVKTYHLTFESAAEAWGDEILPGLHLYQDKGDPYA